MVSLAMRSMPMAIARSLSIIGHPFVVIPAAVLTLLLYGHVPSAAPIVSVVCGICAVVFAFSLWQVRRGQWQHIDASGRTERSSLNIFLAAVLFLSAGIGFYQLRELGLPLGLLLSGVLIVVVMLVSSRHQPSRSRSCTFEWVFNVEALARSCWPGRKTAQAGVCGSILSPATLRHAPSTNATASLRLRMASSQCGSSKTSSTNGPLETTMRPNHAFNRTVELRAFGPGRIGRLTWSR